MAMQLNEEHIRKKAKEILGQGIAKQRAYEQLIDEFGKSGGIAQILKGLPSKKAWEKYGIWNHVLGG